MILAYEVLAVAAALLALGAVLWPYLALRAAMAAVTRSVLWLRVEGGPVPPAGPLLMVTGPAGHLGWLNLLAACPRRVRFLVLAGWGRAGVTGWLLRRAGAIVPDGPDDDALRRALDRAGDALRSGEVVCLFAEGCRTSDGHFWAYSRAFASLPAAPVLPAAMLQPTGSLFAMHGERFIVSWPTGFAS
ncbi:MAG: lysophospholipid acyltransferase family protein, partial [Gemmataceae bacterium]